jgi:lipoprotein-releasing system permease protein
MRALRILEYALASLLRRPGKTCAILLVYTLMIMVLASVLFLTQALKTEATTMLADGPQLIVQQTLAGRHELISLEEVDSISRIPGVKAVKPRIWGYYYDALTGTNYTLQGIGDESGDELSLLDGRLPSGDE